MLLHYLGKLKNHKFANFHARKTRFKCVFLSSIQQIKENPNVVKISAKINTMQKYQHFTFCSFPVLNILKECLIAVWSDFRQVIIDTAADQ